MRPSIPEAHVVLLWNSPGLIDTRPSAPSYSVETFFLPLITTAISNGLVVKALEVTEIGSAAIGHWEEEKGILVYDSMLAEAL